jgi:hypothetical protein
VEHVVNDMKHRLSAHIMTSLLSKGTAMQIALLTNKNCQRTVSGEEMETCNNMMHAIMNLSTSPVGRGRERDKMTTKDQHRVKVIRTEQKAVGHQAPQERRNLVTGWDNDDGDEVAQDKLPRKPPDKGLSVLTVEDIIVH